MDSKPLAFVLLILVLALPFPDQTHGDPWVNAGDQRTRHHLLVLADSKHINLPLNAWPILWNDIKQELDRIDISALKLSEVWSFRYLKHELRKAMKPLSGSTNVFLSEIPPYLLGYSSPHREKTTLDAGVGILSDNYAFKLQGQIVDKPSDNKSARLDGSYAATRIGNWTAGVGAIDRWWGPGWQSSLSLSNNARPSPGFFLQRSDSNANNLPWAPPWSLSVFVSQLEKERTIAKAELRGARLSLKPMSFLELGIQQTSLKGGETETRSKGIKIRAFDWRASLSVFNIQAALYQQWAQRPDSNTEEDQEASLMGIEAAIVLYNVHSRIIVENSDSIKNGSEFYDHAVYTDAYRYYGRELADAAGSNHKTQSIRGRHFLDNGHQVFWKLTKLKPGEAEHAIEFAELSYGFPVNTFLFVNIGTWQFKERANISGEQVNTGAFFTLEYAY